MYKWFLARQRTLYTDFHRTLTATIEVDQISPSSDHRLFTLVNSIFL